MIMSHDERQLPATTILENISTPISLKHQKASALDHQKQSDSRLDHYDASAKAEATSSPRLYQHQPQQKQTIPNVMMAMHNFGQNPLQQEHQQQIEHTQTNNVTNNNSSQNDISENLNTRQSVVNSTSNSSTNNSGNTTNNNISNINNNNNNNNDNDTKQKLLSAENNNAVIGGNRAVDRQQSQPSYSQSQQYHGIFSPQIPASLQSSLASRVDQIIRTTLHDSPAYTPPTSKNSNINNSCVSASMKSSNMPSPSSLIFNPASNMMSTPVSSAPASTFGHHTNSSGGPISTTTTSSLTCMPTPISSDHHKLQAYAPERIDNVDDFVTRSQQNNAGNNISSRMIPQHPSLSHLPPNWQEHMSQPNGAIPKLAPAHGSSSSSSPFAASQGPYSLMAGNLQMGLNLGNNSMISQDGDNVSRLNPALRNASNQPPQIYGDKNLPPNFANLSAKQSSSGPFDVLRNSQSVIGGNDTRMSNQQISQELNERITEEKLAIFAYNLLSAALPGTNRCKKIVHMDEDLRESIQNGEFYTKYDNLASGILSNTILVPNFSIIDYLRRDRFSFQEVERIERVNRKLSASNFACLMELVRQRPFIPQTSKQHMGIVMDKPAYNDNLPMNPNTTSQSDITGLQQPFTRTGNFPISPDRHDMSGPMSLDKTHRSSQSPSYISRSQMGNNASNIKYTNTSNQFLPNPINPSHCSIGGGQQFAHSPYPVIQQKTQHVSPQANRSSPFQQPASMYPQVLLRPSRSHSTIGSLNISLSNETTNTSPIRQPPAAHQNSSRPNLTALTSEISSAHTHNNNVPVTAHMSSKTPQTPKLPDNLGVLNPSPIKNSLSIGSSTSKHLANRDLTVPVNSDCPMQMGRQDLDAIHGLPIQALLSLRHQENSTRELAPKPLNMPSQSTVVTSNVISQSIADMSRQSGLDSQYYLPQSLGQNQHQATGHPYGVSNINTYRNQNIKSSNISPTCNVSIPAPVQNSSSSSTTYNQQISNDILNKSTSLTSNMCSQNIPTNDSNQYNALLSTFQQQQIMLSSKLIDNGPGALNTTNRSLSIENQPLRLNEPMSVDTQSSRQPLSQTNSPKANNQRSIITGSVATASKKSKKIKTSPQTPNQVLDDKVSVIDRENNQTSQKLIITTELTLPSDLQSCEMPQDKSDVVPQTSSGSQVVAPINAHSASTILERVATDHLSTQESSVEVTKEINEIPCDPSVNKSSSSKLLTGMCESSTEKPSSIIVDAKSNTNVDLNLQNNNVPQPSKYQKIFHKKAWLKNYDEEDQARSSEGNSNNNDKIVAETTAPVVKLEQELQDNICDEKSNASISELNGNAKEVKTIKSDSKKKVKCVKSKRTSLRPNRATNKNLDNDSEETTASISDLDDTDESDSMKSSSEKRVRRMPRRKVKSGVDRDSLEQLKDVKIKTSKDKDLARRRNKKDITSTDATCIKRKYVSDDESIKHKSKKVKDENSDQSDSTSPKCKKRPGEKFLQTQPCYEIVPKNIRCLECRRVRQSSMKGEKILQSKQASKTNWDDFCRFFEFRKLRYNKASQIVVAGFSDSNDAKDTDKQIWLPFGDQAPTNITYKVSKFILDNIGDEFCNLVRQERMVIKNYETRSGDHRTTWKRAVNGLRELCDVCSTTLFNCHYVCERCGFVVCIDCHQSRANNHQDIESENDSIKKEAGDSGDSSRDPTDQNISNKKNKRDSSGWIFCAKNEEHSHDKLALAKIIAGNCLEEVWKILHETRQRYSHKACSCKGSSTKVSGNQENGNVSNNQQGHEVETGKEGSHSTLKGLLLSTKAPMNGQSLSNDENPQSDIGLDVANPISGDNTDKVLDFCNEDDSQDDSRQVSAAIEGCIASLNIEEQDDTPEGMTSQAGVDLDIGLCTRLCEGDLLVLTNPSHKANIRLFREHWKRSLPVLVRNIHKQMNIDMWLPQFFSGKFGEYRSDLVDCRNGDIHRQSMRKYWDGFEPNPAKKRPKEDGISSHIPTAANEEPSAITTSYYSGSALWRLKDWPPGQDFKEILPEHYEDFMNNLPLNSYTTRTGRLNLACRLPKEMLKPDLGPKMYSAYGTTKFPERGTTNLHLDISDAVNVMVYVGGATPLTQGLTEYSDTYEKTIDECQIDPIMKNEIKEHNLIPGALWHIFKPSDVSRMREFLNKVSDECNISQEKRNDPIHDQIWYLDQTLLDRLFTEYGVKSYPILQCMGDAILIPAGAPHQVKNLQNCIKVANDFVSPENVRYCLQLTNEFRNLPETHINQEDKLQIKNILYHSVKESIHYINMFESGKITAKDEPSDEDD